MHFYDLLLEEERCALIKEVQWLRPDEFFDDITFIASYICQTPIALLTLIDNHYQTFKSSYGLDPSVTKTDREASFCHHTLQNKKNEPLVVEDAHLDPRFMENPLVLGYPNIRFYCGYPFTTQENVHLGTLCVIDTKPRNLSEDEKSCLNRLARMASSFAGIKHKTK
jgi:GAF domain-containing protein